MRKLYRLLTFLTLFVLIFSVAAVAAAQEATLEPTVEVTPNPPPVIEPPAPAPIDVVPVDVAANEFLKVIMAIVSSPIGAGVTVFVVSLLKKIRALDGISSQTLAVFVAGAFTVAVWIARYFGVEVQLNSIFHLIEVAGPVVLQVVGTLFGAGLAYNYARRNNTPLLSTVRPKSFTPPKPWEASW